MFILGIAEMKYWSMVLLYSYLINLAYLFFSFSPFPLVNDSKFILYRADGCRPAPEKGDQAVGAGASTLAGLGGQHHRSVTIGSSLMTSYSF